MIILGTLGVRSRSTIVLNPFFGQVKIDITTFRNTGGGIVYSIEANDEDIEVDSLFVGIEGKEIPYNDWINSVRNPYTLMAYSVETAVKDLRIINNIARKFTCEVPINSHFAESHSEHMLQAFLLNVAEKFPDTWKFDVLPSCLRVSYGEL